MTAQPRLVESPLLKPIEAAIYLRMSRAWVWLHRVELGVILVGSKMRYTQAGLDAYLLRQRICDEQPADDPIHIDDARTARQAPHTHPTLINPVSRRPWTCCPAPQQHVRASGGRGEGAR